MLALLESAVLRARLSGASWADVGRSLGITRQAARQRWCYLDDADDAGPIAIVIDQTPAGRKVSFVSEHLGEALDPTPGGRRRSLKILEGTVVETSTVLAGAGQPALLASQD
jgi:hypothetical protein